jgi:hypothetical protein
VIARLQAGHALAHFHHNPAAFMAEHRREDAFRVVARERKRIGMTYAGMGDFDQHFAFLRRCHVNFNDFERLAGAKCNCSARFHMSSFLSGMWIYFR